MNNNNNNNRNNNRNYAQSDIRYSKEKRSKYRELVADPHALQAISSKLPRRPSSLLQHKCYSIKLKSNSASMIFRCEKLTKYDIEFIPPIAEDAKATRRQAINNCAIDIKKIYGTYFDDNTRVYAVNCVQETSTFIYKNGCKFLFKFGQTLKIQSLDLQYKKQIQGVILNSLIRKAGLQRFGRAHYDMRKQARLPIRGDDFINIPKNLSLLPGFRTSLETTVNGVMIGIDTCHRLIEDTTLRELMDTYWNHIEKDCHHNNPNVTTNEIQNQWQHFCDEKLLSRYLQVYTNGKLYRIDEINYNLTINSYIPNVSPPITIAQHWSTQYDIDLLHCGRGIVVHFSKLKKNESQQQIVFIPPEICCLTGCGSEHRNRRSVTTGISKATKIPAFHRMKSTNQLVAKFHNICKFDDDIKPFIDIPSPQTTEINAQILTVPQIHLQTCTTKPPRIIKTGPEMLQFDWKGCSFVEKGGQIKNWGIIFNTKVEASVNEFLNHLKQYATEGGFPRAIDIDNVFRIKIEDHKNGFFEWRNTLNGALDHYHCANGKFLRAIIAIIPSYPTKVTNQIYKCVKEVCSTERAILSQCILENHMSKNHVINGVLRQLLVKLGSIPWKIQFNLPYKKLDIINKPTMIVGINVNHAQKCSASAVGYAASFDKDFVRYFTRVIHQKQGKEIINGNELSEHFDQSIQNFYQINHCYPVQIIIYRDGVSETQIEECVNTELKSIKNLLKNKYPSFNILIEFLAVQKRVNARFLISRNLESAPPGCAINNTVVSNQFWDFYLVPSKPPPKCVAIPTRIIVICDELNLSDNTGKGESDLMHFTNSLCTLYFNWPGPTRVPAPIKYAQKIAQQYCQTLPQKHPHWNLELSYHFL